MYFRVHFTPTDPCYCRKLSANTFIRRGKSRGKEVGKKSAGPHFVGENGEERKNKTSAQSPCEISRVSATKTVDSTQKANFFFFFYFLTASDGFTRPRSVCSLPAVVGLTERGTLSYCSQSPSPQFSTKDSSSLCRDLWRPCRLPSKLERPDNAGLCEVNYPPYPPPSAVTTSRLKAGKCGALCPK